MFAGALADAWSHVNVVGGDPVFNVWHLPVYASFVGLIALLALPIVGRAAKRRHWRTVIPRSYRFAYVGGIVFASSGLLDTAWHAVFGIEASTEALLSPTHLGLAIGAALLWSGPLVTAWRRRAAIPGRKMFPALVAFSLIAGLAAFTTHFAHPLVDPWPAFPFAQSDPRLWYVPSLGFAALVIQVAVLMGAALSMIRRWPTLPLGAMTVLFLVCGAGLAPLHGYTWLAGVAIITGVFADALLSITRAGAKRGWAIRGFAVSVPLFMAVTYMALVDVWVGVAWSAHLVGGVPLISGATGLLVSLLVFPPGPTPESIAP
jgi:hypothetical protein